VFICIRGEIEAGILLAVVGKKIAMKKLLLFSLIALFVGLVGTGCLPPPHQGPGPKPPTPPGGPSAVSIQSNIGNLRG
jgi:hypothetical protein